MGTLDGMGAHYVQCQHCRSMYPPVWTHAGNVAVPAHSFEARGVCPGSNRRPLQVVHLAIDHATA